MILFGRLGDWLYIFKSKFLSPAVKQDKFFVWLLALGGLLTGLNFLVVGVFFLRLPNIMIFHSNIYFGPDLSGERYYIFSPPLLGAVIVLAHHLLAMLLYPNRQTLSLMLMTGSVVINMFLLVATVLILRLNI